MGRTTHPRRTFAIALCALAPLAAAARAENPSAAQWLNGATDEAVRIGDPAARMTAWWRVAGVAAYLGDDTLCEKAIQSARAELPAGADTGRIFADATAARLTILAKAAAGKWDQAEALVPPPAAGAREDVSANAATLAWVRALARSGDTARALKAAEAFRRPSSFAYGEIATEQAKRGDKAGAVESARLVIKAGTNPEVCQEVAVDLVKFANADEGARTVARLYEPSQDVMLAEVGKAEVEAGRDAEARKTLDLIKDDKRKDPVKEAMAVAMVRHGDVDGGKAMAASMAWHGTWGTSKQLVEAALDAGNLDGAAQLARELSPAGDNRLTRLVDAARAKGRSSAIDRAKATALALKDGTRRFSAIVAAARSLHKSDGSAAAQAWRESLTSPADRAAVDVGAAMSLAGLEPQDVGAPELMMSLAK